MSEPRRCPSCRIELDPVHVPDKYGREIEIDQCPQCRGIYFDRGELFRLDGSVVRPLEAVAPNPTAALAHSNGGGCPGCDGALSRLQSQGLPETLHAWHCAACYGFWLSEEDVFEFYEFRNKQLAALKERERNKPQGPSPEAKARVMREMQKDLTEKVVLPAAVLAAPVWVQLGLVLTERLWPSLKRRFKGSGREP